jgi:hypothetical protein
MIVANQNLWFFNQGSATSQSLGTVVLSLPKIYELMAFARSNLPVSVSSQNLVFDAQIDP